MAGTSMPLRSPGAGHDGVDGPLTASTCQDWVVATNVLVPPHVGLGVCGWDQSHVMAQLAQLTRPVVGRGTGFHADQTWRQLGEERHDPVAAQRATQGHCSGCIYPVHLED